MRHQVSLPPYLASRGRKIKKTKKRKPTEFVPGSKNKSYPVGSENKSEKKTPKTTTPYGYIGRMIYRFPVRWRKLGDITN
jgi:hypothetical protein